MKFFSSGKSLLIRADLLFGLINTSLGGPLGPPGLYLCHSLFRSPSPNPLLLPSPMLRPRLIS
jgi:hypothetical protein